MKVLHIVPDDKFWKPVLAIFNRIEVENEYVSILEDNEQLLYIDSDQIVPITEEDATSLWKRSDVDIYVFHSIPVKNYDRILSVGKDKTVIVVSWGYDIYYSQNGCPPLLPLTLYKPLTIRLMNRMERVPFWTAIKRCVKRMVYCEKSRKYSEAKKRWQTITQQKQRKAIDRVDYWATILPNEYEMLKDNLGMQARYLPFHYSGTSRATKYPRIDTNKACDILIGNSADPSNNHIDVIDLLRKRGIKNKLYLPMAYDDDVYRSHVSKYLIKHSIESEIQQELLSPSDYREKLLNCRAAVFGHIRQQAIGNIVICMRSGIKVFLFKDSVAYKFFKSIGSYVFSIEEDLTVGEIGMPLTEEENEVNLQKLDWLSLEEIVSRLKPIFKGIEEQIVNG